MYKDKERMSTTPPRVERIAVCPGAPGRPDAGTISRVRQKMAECKEANRQKMMATAAPQLAYMKSMKALIDATPSTDETSSTKAETIAFFDAKIEALELDAAGKPRYIYTLNIKDDNGDEVTHDVKEFTTSQKVYEYINRMVMNDDAKEIYDYEEKPYTVPCSDEMDATMDADKYRVGKIILTVGDDDGTGYCIVFTLKRIQVNY
jgi:hypothetical protein